MLQRKKAAHPHVLKCPRYKVRIGKGQAELVLAEDDKKNNKRWFSCIDQSKKKEVGNGAAEQRMGYRLKLV